MQTEARHLETNNTPFMGDFTGDNQVREKLESAQIEGFIHHPKNFPLTVRKLWFKKSAVDDLSYTSGEGLGLYFRSEKYLSPGSNVEVSIPLRGEEQKFTGQVVLVKNQGEEYEIGLWFEHKDDIHRARIVEQICHIEAYLHEKRRQEGPFVSSEHVAQEWINKFAAAFPSV